MVAVDSNNTEYLQSKSARCGLTLLGREMREERYWLIFRQWNSNVFPEPPAWPALTAQSVKCQLPHAE